MILGGLVAVPCGIVFGSHVLGTVRSAPAIDVPGTVEMDLETGPYMVYEHTGSRSGFGGFNVSEDDGPTITPAQLTVTGPDGQHRRGS